MTDLVFDIYGPLTGEDVGTRLLRLTREEYGAGTFYKHTLSGIGAGQIVCEKGQSFVTAANFAEGNYCIVRDLDLSATDTLNVIGGFIFEQDFLRVVADPGAQVYRFGGPSTIALLKRAVMGPESLSPFEGPSSIVDGYWRWGNDTYGGVRRRALFEANLQDPAGLPMIDTAWVGADDIFWNDNDDSNGDPFPSFVGEFKTRCGTDLFTLDNQLMSFGLERDIDARTFAMYTYNEGGFGTDRSSATFASGKVRFVAGVNIAKTLDRNVRGDLPLTHVLVRTTDWPQGSWIESDTYSPGDPVRKGVYQTGDISGDPALSTAIQQRVQRLMRLRVEAEDGVDFYSSKPGNSPLTGQYQPGPNYSPGATATAGHYWVGDWITIHSGTGEHDYNNAKKRIESITYELTTAADDDDHGWNVIIGIGPRVGSLGTSYPADPVPLAFTDAPGKACRDLTAADLEAIAVTNGDAEDTGGGQFSGGAYSTTQKHGGTHSYAGTGTDVTLVYTFSGTFTAGVRYVVDVWNRRNGTHIDSDMKFGVAGGDEEIETGLTSSDFIATEDGTDGDEWGLYRLCWTPNADRTGVRVSLRNRQSSSTYFGIDDVTLYTAAAASDISGESPTPARSDHGHRHNDLEGRESPDTHPASTITFDPTGTSTSETNVQEALEDALASAGYSDEQAQDAVGTILVDSSTVDLTYTDATPSITAAVIPAGIPLDDLGSPADNTDLNASTSAHGLLRKLDNDPTHYLDGTGAWSEPAAGTGGVLPWIIPPPWGLLHRAMQNLGANNRCIYWPVVIPKACTITGLRIRVGTSSGTMGVAMYDESLSTRLATSGSVSTPASGLATVSFGTPASVAAGRYWFAMSCSTTSASFSIADDNNIASPAVGMFQDTAHPPPASPSGLAATLRNPNAFGIIDGISGYP